MGNGEQYARRPRVQSRSCIRAIVLARRRSCRFRRHSLSLLPCLVLPPSKANHGRRIPAALLAPPAGPISARSRCWYAIVSAIYGARLTDQPGRGRRKPLGDRCPGDAHDRRLDRAAATGRRVSRAAADDDVVDGGGRRGCAATSIMVAIRLPSVVAVVLTSLLIYGYTRALVSGFAAFVAALAYASMGQVLQIGRMGESEAVFALLRERVAARSGTWLTCAAGRRWRRGRSVSRARRWLRS